MKFIVLNNNMKGVDQDGAITGQLATFKTRIG